MKSAAGFLAIYMTILHSLVQWISVRLAQGIALALTCSLISLLLLLALTSYRLASSQQQLLPMVTAELRKALGRDVRIGSVQMEGWDSLLITDAAIAKGATFKNGNAFSAKQVIAKINLLKFAFQQGQSPIGAVRQIIFDQPTIEVARSAEGNWDFQDVVDRLNRDKTAGIIQAQLIVSDGKLNYHDARGFSSRPELIRQHLVSVSAKVTPTGGDAYKFEVAARDAENNLGKVHLAGNYSRTAGIADINLTANKVAVKEIARYLPKPLPLTFEDGTAAFRLSALLKNLPSPEAAHTLPTTALTAEVDLAGVGLRFSELSAPIMASSGKLRMVHNPDRYPQGSRIEFIDVDAHAAEIPIRLSGSIDDLNLLDLPHLNPYFNLRVLAQAKDGTEIARLLPGTKILLGMTINGPLSLDVNTKGHHNNLQITGMLKANRLNVAAFSGRGVSASFTLLPGTGGDGSKPSISAAFHIKDAEGKGINFSDIELTVRSDTPWRHLDDSFHVTGTANAKTGHSPWGDIENISSSFNADRELLSLSQAHADIFGGHITGEIALPLSTQMPGTVTATVQFNGIDLAQIAKPLKIANLYGAGEGKLDLSMNAYNSFSLKGNIAGKNIGLGKYLASSLVLSLESETKDNSTRVAISSALADTNHGKFSITNGSYTATLGNLLGGTLDLPLSGEQIPLAEFIPTLTGLGYIQGTLTGSFNMPDLIASVESHGGTVMGHVFKNAKGDLHLQGKTLHIRNLSFSRDGILVSIPGGPDGIDPTGGFLDIPITVTLNGAKAQDLLDMLNLEIPWGIDGNTYGTLNIRQTAGGTVAFGAVEIPQPVLHIPSDGVINTLPLDVIAMQFDVADRKMQIRSLVAQLHGSKAEAEGTAYSPVSGQVAANLVFHSDGAMLEDLPQSLLKIPVALSGPSSLHGTLDGVLSGTGPEPLLIKINANSQKFSMEGVPVGSGNIDLTYHYRPNEKELRINNGEITNPAFHAASTGDFILTGKSIKSAQISFDRIDVAALKTMVSNAYPGGKYGFIKSVLREIPSELAGKGNADISLKGDFQRPELALNLSLPNPTYKHINYPNIHAQITSEMEDGRYALRIVDAVAEGGASQASGRISGIIFPGDEFNLHYSAMDITGKELSPWIGKLPLDGRSSIKGTISGRWNSPVMDGELQVSNPVIAHRTFSQAKAHLRLSTDVLAISNGSLQLTQDSKPLAFNGEVPWQLDKPLSLGVTLPRQNLELLRSLIPELQEAQGSIEGNIQIGGTLTEPRITDGRLQMNGDISLPAKDPNWPNRINDIDIRLSISHDGRQSKIDIYRIYAALDRLENGKRPRAFKAGQLVAEGSASFGANDFLSPNNWQWDIYTQAENLPLPASLTLLPEVSGSLHLMNDNGSPLIQGVLFADNMKIKAPTMSSSAAHWGPFLFNPRFSVVMQIGEKVKIAKGIVRLPLKSTPLVWPVAPTSASDNIDKESPLFAYSAGMLNQQTSSELTGSWGTLTGTLNDPRLYARFEVNKKKLAFPFSLFGSIRNAKGHLTYSMTDGPQLSMGIPDYPPVTATALFGSP